MRLAGELDVSRASCVIGALGTGSGVTVTQSRSPLPPPTPPLMSAVCPARAAPGTAPRGSRHPGPPPGLACRRAVSGQQGQAVGRRRAGRVHASRAEAFGVDPPIYSSFHSPEYFSACVGLRFSQSDDAAAEPCDAGLHLCPLV